MKQDKATLSPDQMATLAVNLLNQRLLEAGRTEAKQLFRKIEGGDKSPITNLRTEDDGLIRVDLTLDASAFVGVLNFSAFRDGVTALLAELAKRVQAEEPLKTFSPLESDGETVDESVPTRLFAAGGATVHEENHNLLMLGVSPDPEQPVLVLQLMYVDPTQFQSPAATS